MLIIKPLRQTKAERGGEVAAKSWAASEGLRKVPPQYPSVPKFPNLLVIIVLQIAINK